MWLARVAKASPHHLDEGRKRLITERAVQARCGCFECARVGPRLANSSS